MTDQPDYACDSDVRLSRDARGKLAFARGDDSPATEDVRIVRCCPWSNPWRYIAVRDKDGIEVHLFETLDPVEAQTRALIEEELGQQEFLPRITGILAVDDGHGVVSWSVETDRGVIDLMVKDTDDIRHFEDGRVLIRDHAGGVFLIPDPEALDTASRALLDQYLA